MRRKIRTSGVFIAGKTLGGQLRQERFIGAVVHGVQLSLLFLRPPLLLFALPFVSVKLPAAVFEELAYPAPVDVLAAHAVVSHNSVDAGGKGARRRA